MKEKKWGQFQFGAESFETITYTEGISKDSPNFQYYFIKSFCPELIKLIKTNVRSFLMRNPRSLFVKKGRKNMLQTRNS